MEMSPGWRPSAALGELSGLIFTYGGSWGSDQTTFFLLVSHCLIFVIFPRYPRYHHLCNKDTARSYDAV